MEALVRCSDEMLEYKKELEGKSIEELDKMIAFQTTDVQLMSKVYNSEYQGKQSDLLRKEEALGQAYQDLVIPAREQLALMKGGGNADLIAFWKKHGVDPRMPHNAKYHEPASQLYADRLKAKVEGRPLPTKLPARQAAPTSAYDAPGGGSMSAGGFGGGDSKGSAALAGETTEQYVARQRRLQAEARARMRAKSACVSSVAVAFTSLHSSFMSLHSASASSRAASRTDR